MSIYNDSAQGYAPLYVYDLELFPNYFLAVFKAITPGRDGEFIQYTITDLDELKAFVSQPNLTLVGYNNFNFDDALLKIILDNPDCTTEFLCDWANRIIKESEEDKQAILEYRYSVSGWISIDLMQILGGPGLAGSLKSHEIRLGMLNVQDLPYPPGSMLSLEQIIVVRDYCQHDVNATEALYHDLQDKINVRYGVNSQYPYLKNSALRRSDASIAEAVMKKEYLKKSGRNSKDIQKPQKFIFKPDKRIDPNIRFTNPHNQVLLERLRTLSPFEAKDWTQKKLNESFVFRVGNHSINLGSGGLHTIIGHCVIESEAILEFDVASYYPSLLRKFKNYPIGLTEHWIKILNGLTDERLAAKHNGDKAKAEVYKIIINSLYGKMADKTSFNRDDALQLQVTLNGQLFLIMLMEQFHIAGFEVISGNTDGVYIKADNRIDEAQAVADEWMKDTGFTLESKTSTRFVSTAINDYALYHPDLGWYHRKGGFANNKRTKPSIITDAVLNAISTDEPVDSYIRRGENLLDYLYSGSVRDSKVTQLKHGDNPAQKTNRWYKSSQGQAIKKCTLVDGVEKWSQVPNTDQCNVANRLETFSIPGDLDFDYYIQEAQTLLDNLNQQKAAKEVVQSKLIKEALKAQSKGLVIVPKGRRGKGYEKAGVANTYSEETISYWKETPLEQADWFGYQGFGAYTGKQFGIVGIDIDHLEKAKNTRLFELLNKSGMVCWHGGCDAEEVRSGKKRGTVLYSYQGDSLKTTGSQFFNEFGFEILYGNRVVQLAGKHTSGEDYRYKGKPTPIPKDLLNLLEWSIPELDTERPVDDGNTPYLFGDNSAQLLEFQRIANSDEEYLALGGRLVFKQTQRVGRVLSGVCIGHQEHTNRANDQNMQVTELNGHINVHCFHNSCRPVRKAWENRIKDQLVVLRPVNVKPENLLVLAEAKEIAEALADESRFKQVIAPTGSGKTYNLVTYIIPFLDSESGNQDKFAIICSDKDQMVQLSERFANILETDNINECGIDLIEATGDIRIGKARSVDAVKNTTRVAITHYTYVSRRGFSVHYYAFLKFIDENTHVFIDEMDAFIESQVTTLALGSRWRSYAKAGKIKHVQVPKCGMFHGFNNCSNCHMRQYDGYKIDVDNYRNLGYVSVHEFMEGTQHEEMEHIDFDDRIVNRVRVGNYEITMLSQVNDPGTIQFENPGVDPMADFRTIVDDHLNAGYLPTVYRPLIVYDDEEITREALVEQFSTDSGLNLAAIPETERRKLRFPSRACNVLTLTLIDRRPLLWMANAKSLTGLTATLSPHHQNFLAETLPGLKLFDIPPKEDRKMDKIIVAGTSQNLPLKLIIDGHWQFKKMFRFRETKAAAVRDFEELSKSTIPVRLGFNKSQFMLTSDEHEYGQHKVLQTYSFGSLGRGIDFADYPLVDMNASVFKPVSAHVTDDPEVIKQIILEDRATTIKQNVGRILRRPKDVERVVKMIVLEELETEDELTAISQKLSGMSIGPVESWWVPSYLAKEEIGEWLSRIETGQAIPVDIPRDYKILIERAIQLIESGANKNDIKLKLRWATIRKSLDSDQILEVEQAIDQILENHRKTGGAINDKVERQRDKRLKTLQRLKAQGKSDAVIRRDMKVFDAKRPWAKSEQDWFESVLKSKAVESPENC